MNAFLSLSGLTSGATSWILFMLDLTLKGSLILTTAFLISKLFTKAPFQFHHLIIFLGLGSLAILPVIYLFGEFAINPAAFNPSLSGAPAPYLSWLAFCLMTVWFLGFTRQLLKIIVSIMKMRRLSKHAWKMEQPSWNRRLKSICLERNIQRRIELRQSCQYPAPITCGFFQGVIILPKEASEWTTEQQQVVLLHELSHILRHDNLLQLIARIMAAVFWFNPLVWTAVRLLGRHREGACDDYVINAGFKPSVYAGHLLNMIQSYRKRPSTLVPGSRNSAAVYPGAAKERLLNILDTSRMSRVLSPRWVTISIVIGVLFIMPLSTLNPVAATEKIIPGSRSAFYQPGPSAVNQVKATPSPTTQEIRSQNKTLKKSSQD